jgi:putative sigma-54 modulation protein
MQVQMTGRHMTLTDSIKERTEKEVAQFEKFVENILSTHITFDSDKAGCEVTIDVKVHGDMLTTIAKGDNVFAALEACTDKMKRRLKDYKERLKERKRHAEPTHEAVQKISKPEEEEED